MSTIAVPCQPLVCLPKFVHICLIAFVCRAVRQMRAGLGSLSPGFGTPFLGAPKQPSGASPPPITKGTV